MTAHNSANIDEIAKTVIMPGDPLRSKLIAEKFLTDYKLVNNVRGVQGYTGYYNDKLVTVMASGMGNPSMGIYSYELFKFYDVENIIRVGSAGAYSADLKLFDVVVADSAYSESTYAKEQCGNTSDIQYPSEELNAKIIASAKNLGIETHVGCLHSSDVFYRESKDYLKTVEEKEIDTKNTCKVYRDELQRLKTLLDESVGVPANLVSVDKSLSRIRLEMEE